MELPVYLDTQSSGRIAPEVREAIYAYWQEGNGNPHSPHEQGRRARTNMSTAIAEIADFIGCLPRELTLLSGATAANNLAIKGVEPLSSNGKQKVLVSAIEHPCVLEAAKFIGSHRDFEVKVIPVDGSGFIDMKTLKESLDEQVALVSVMLGNNEVGTIQDIAEISRLAHEVEALVHTDATQACGRIPVDVLDLDCDMLSLSAHKIAGPIGVGALFVKSGIDLMPLIHGGNQQTLASGTMSPELAVGFAAACRNASSQLNASERHRQIGLISDFENGLRGAGYLFRKNGPQENNCRLPGTTHLTFQNIDMQDLQAWISPYVSFSTKSACATESSEISHVLEAIGLNIEEANNSARFSVSYRTGDDEIGAAIGYFKEYLNSVSARGAAE
jgi:cysteine desulfurase